MAVSSLQAANLSPSCTSQGLHTLQDYLNLAGDLCSVGILDFSHFTFHSSGTGATYSASQIDVTTVFDGTNTGLAYSTFDGNGNLVPFSVAAGDNATYYIGYTFVIDPGPVDTGMDLGLDPPVGNVIFTQSLCADNGIFINTDSGAPLSCMGDPGPRIQSLSVDNTNPPTSLTGHLNLNPPATSFATVVDTIALVGGTSGASFDMATTTSRIVDTSAPEPVGFLLCLSGLVGIAVRRRQLRHG